MDSYKVEMLTHHFALRLFFCSSKGCLRDNSKLGFQNNGAGWKRFDDLDRVNEFIDLEALHPFRGERMPPVKVKVTSGQVRNDGQVEDTDAPGYFLIAGGESAPLSERDSKWVASARFRKARLQRKKAPKLRILTHFGDSRSNQLSECWLSTTTRMNHKSFRIVNGLIPLCENFVEENSER